MLSFDCSLIGAVEEVLIEREMEDEHRVKCKVEVLDNISCRILYPYN